MTELQKEIHVSVPFTMLKDTYLPHFLKHGIHPEIGLDAVALDRYDVSDFRRIAEELRVNDLCATIHGPFTDLSPGSPDPEVRALTRRRFEQSLRVLALFTPKTAVFHAGYDSRRYVFMRDQWIEESVKMWSWLASRIRGEGGNLMLENVYEYGPHEMLGVLDRLKDQGVGCCLDTGHLTAFGQAPLEMWLHALLPYLGEVHLHDNSGDHDDHLALGHGRIDFSRLFHVLRAANKRPLVVTLEPHREEDLRSSLEYLEKIWPW